MSLRDWTKQSGAFTVKEFIKAQGELITNGDFSDGGTSWVFQSNWSLISNKLFCDGTQTTIDFNPRQLIFSNAVGKKYLVKYTISDYVSGSINVFLANTTLGTTRMENGSFLDYLTIKAGSYTNYFYFMASADFVGAIDNVSVTEVDPLPTITDGTKYLECTGLGHISIQNKQAYGIWEFDIKKTAGSTNIIEFISDKQNTTGDSGYAIYTSGDNEIALIKRTAGASTTLMASANGYILPNIWYRVKIERTIYGSFSIYIKGDSFGNNWTLVSTTGGSGTNPVTDNTYNASNYFTIKLNSGNKIANIHIYDGVRK